MLRGHKFATADHDDHDDPVAEGLKEYADAIFAVDIFDVVDLLFVLELLFVLDLLVLSLVDVFGWK